MQDTSKHDDPRIVFDRDLALTSLGNDVQLMSELTELFISDVANMVEKIRDAARAGDGPSLGRAAHQLKGAASNFHAQLTVEAAQRLERMGHANDLSGVPKALEALLGEIDRLKRELEKLIQA
ncbi:MAG: Hpt domain-containing protein [Myxococcota bacterium]|nr:Hpt domain-containing protein [Myxococcota bacterium]